MRPLHPWQGSSPAELPVVLHGEVPAFPSSIRLFDPACGDGSSMSLRGGSSLSCVMGLEDELTDTPSGTIDMVCCWLIKISDNNNSVISNACFFFLLVAIDTFRNVYCTYYHTTSHLIVWSYRVRSTILCMIEYSVLCLMCGTCCWVRSVFGFRTTGSAVRNRITTVV
jgi:hypothetical protein